MIERRSQAEEVFSDAWQKVLAGRTIESVLAEYPGQAAELEPMLRLTKRVRAISLSSPQLSPDALSRIRQHMRSAQAEHSLVAAEPDKPDELPLLSQAPILGKQLTSRHSPWLARLFAPVQVSSAVLFLLVIVAIAAMVFAVMRPGSDTDTARAVVAYSGTITKMEGAVWQVDDTEVLIDDTTEIHGQPAVGTMMHCIGQQLGDNEMRAFEVWVSAAPDTPTVTPESNLPVVVPLDIASFYPLLLTDQPR